MPRSRRSTPLLSVLLLIGLLIVVGVVLAVLGSMVLLPQGSAMVFLLGAGVLFLAVQLVMFRWLGLRSDADEEPVRDDEAGGDEQDWRAWRG